MDMYTKERYKRWVRQKIMRFVGLIVIFLMLLVNTILLFMLIFNRQECECPNPSNSSNSSHLSNPNNPSGSSVTSNIEDHEAEHEAYRQGRVFNVNVISGRYAFLTFDDGPSPYTRGILDVLNERNVAGVFFVIGDSINRRLDSEVLLNQILDEGHYIGLHTMTHDYETLYSGVQAPQRFVDEMFELNDLVYELTNGFSTNLCRAAYGMSATFTPEHHTAVEQAGLHCVDWNIDSKDWQQRTPYLVYQNVTSQIENKGFPDVLVILFHEFSWTVEALPEIIDYLRYHGYTIIAYTPGDLITY